MALADRIVVMEAGRIAQVGTPRAIYYAPANRHVADFIGSMNRLDGVWRDGHWHCAGGSLATPLLLADSASLYFRPEEAALVAPELATLTGTVESATFLGLRTRVRIAGAAQTVLQVDVPGRRQFAAGEAVGITVAPDCLLALD
jgi:putative spermidine/putrescine transport system ATP-binding protein